MSVFSACVPSAVSASEFMLDLPDEGATIALGAALAQALIQALPVTAGLHVHLVGDLGAGKTTLTRALLRALGHSGPVKSPTYTLVEPYLVGQRALYHFDFYRFQSPEEFTEAGLEEYFQESAICLVEWPDKAEGFLPPADLQIKLLHIGEARQARLLASTSSAAHVLHALENMAPSR